MNRSYAWKNEYYSFLLQEEDRTNKLLDISISVDYVISIHVDDISVGIVYVNPMGESFIVDHKKISIFVEWIELLSPFRGKGLLKEILNGIASFFCTDRICLECSDENLPKYLACGGVDYGISDVTENHVIVWKKSNK